MDGNKKGLADYRGDRDVAALARSGHDQPRIRCLQAASSYFQRCGCPRLDHGRCHKSLVLYRAGDAARHSRTVAGIFVAGVLVRPPAIADLDQALTDLRKAEENARLAVAYGVDVDANGNLPQPLTPPSPPRSFSERKGNAKKALQRYKEMADRVEVMIESALESQTERRRLDPDLGENRRFLG